jgi:hypothetical protein
VSEPDAERNDPTRHMVSLALYSRSPDGASIRRELPLDDEAASLARGLAGARQDEAGIENDSHTGQVAFSRGRGLILATLLEELAARVRPGFTCGPMRGGDELADLCAELAATLEAKRTYSPDYD